jgi:hypothetical protein
MTLISMNIYHIEVNHFKYEIIWQNMQEKISDMFAVPIGISFPLGTDIPVRTATYDRHYYFSTCVRSR